MPIRTAKTMARAASWIVTGSFCATSVVTGTPVGCACGDGMVDWERVIALLAPLDRELVLSVECGTIEQAERSLRHLRSVLGG